MAVKKIYFGSLGPFEYDDADNINDPDGDFSGETMQAVRSDGGGIFDGDVESVGVVIAESLKLQDIDKTHTLQLKWNENDSADRVLNLLVGGGSRSLTVNEDFAIGDGSAGTLTFTQASKVLSVYDSCTLPHLDGKTLQIDGVNSDGGAFSFTTSGTVSFNQVIRGATSLWYRATHLCGISAAPGASGAVWVEPDANTLGGYQLNVNTHKLYFTESITSMWDGASDLEFRANWEVNVDNTGGGDNDTVDLKLICYYKGHGETANKTQTIEVPVEVGKSARYKRFHTVFTINWDETSNIVEVGDKMSFILNLETDTSEVDDVVINNIMCRYPTEKVNVEV